MKSLLRSVMAGGWLVLGLAQANPTDALLARAAAFDKQGKSGDALKVLIEADRLSPDRPDILVRIAKQHGDLITEQRDPQARRASAEASLAFSKRALRLAPDQRDPNLAMAISIGKMTEFMGNREKIEASRSIKKHAERALALDPRSDYAHHMLGRWHQELAGIGGATRALAKLIYGGLPSASYEEAERHFVRARELRPDRLIHVIEHGRTLAEMGRTDEARAVLSKGLGMPSRDKDDEEAKNRGRETLKRIS